MGSLPQCLALCILGSVAELLGALLFLVRLVGLLDLGRGFELDLPRPQEVGFALVELRLGRLVAGWAPCLRIVRCLGVQCQRDRSGQRIL